MMELLCAECGRCYKVRCMPDDPDNDVCPSCGDYLSDENELKDIQDSLVIGDYGYSHDPDDNEYDYPGCPDDNDEHNDQYYDE